MCNAVNSKKLLPSSVPLGSYVSVELRLALLSVLDPPQHVYLQLEIAGCLGMVILADGEM